MRIALDMRSAYEGMGGIGRYAWSLLEQYALMNTDSSFVCYFTHRPPPEPLRLPEHFEVRTFEAGMIDDRFDQLILPTLLEEDEIDVYHNPTFSVPLIRTRAKLVATVHDVVFRRHPELVEPRLRDHLDAATERACSLADAIVTVSAFSQEELVSLYPVDSSKVQVIHNGVHEDKPRASEESSLRPLARLGLTPDKYVLYVGSLEPKKNLALLLDAFRFLGGPGLEQDIPLVLAGARGRSDFDVEEEIRKRELSKRVILPGYVDEDTLESLYQHALAFAYVSLYEGFGLPPLEAMKRGVPTVVSRASSLPEVVGEGALLVDPGDAHELAEALRLLIKDPAFRNKCSEKGRVQASQFTWKKSAESHLELFSRLGSRNENPASCI